MELYLFIYFSVNIFLKIWFYLLDSRIEESVVDMAVDETGKLFFFSFICECKKNLLKFVIQILIKCAKKTENLYF